MSTASECTAGEYTADEYVASLAALPGAGPVRLGRLLSDRGAEEAWRQVCDGKLSSDVAPADVLVEWRGAARATDMAVIAERLVANGVRATTWHDDDHPPQLIGDIDPAPVLFRQGALPDPMLPHVAIVGTRRSSTIGREIARELGAGLAAAGVVVVSGLALGIDGAAHHGALLADGAPPLAVVGSGVDVPYPTQNRTLWADVARAGALVTEAPMGARPDPWRFPARNRLIVALSDLVVVVESRATGGSLLTVDQALRRDIEVMAVPGSLRNGAAVGTNQLLADGCAPVRDVDDVLMALGLDRSGAAERRHHVREVPAVTATEGRILSAVDDGPTSIDQLVERVGLSAGEIYAGITALEVAGHLVHDGARVRRA